MLLNKLPDLHAETSNETLKGAISEVLNQTTTEFTSINNLIEEEATKLFEYPKFFQTKSGQALELFINEFESYYTSKLQALQKNLKLNIRNKTNSIPTKLVSSQLKLINN